MIFGSLSGFCLSKSAFRLGRVHVGFRVMSDNKTSCKLVELKRLDDIFKWSSGELPAAVRCRKSRDNLAIGHIYLSTLYLRPNHIIWASYYFPFPFLHIWCCLSSRNNEKFRATALSPATHIYIPVRVHVYFKLTHQH